jgi:hypothetical protein
VSRYDTTTDVDHRAALHVVIDDERRGGLAGISDAILESIDS